MDKVENLLVEEVCNELSHISKMELGTEATKTAINGAMALADRVLESNKLDIEARKLELEERKLAIEFERNEIDRKDKKTRNIISVGNIAIGAGITVGMGLIGYICEERGVFVASKTGKSFIDKGFNYFFKR